MRRTEDLDQRLKSLFCTIISRMTDKANGERNKPQEKTKSDQLEIHGQDDARIGWRAKHRYKYGELTENR